MGDVVQRRRHTAGGGMRDARARRRPVASVAILTVALALGCASSKPMRVAEAAPEPATTKGGGAAASPAIEVRSLELREGAPEVFLDLQASAPLIWTSYRNADGRIVLELPNAVPVAALSDRVWDDGLISKVEIERGTEGSRPLTRLLVETRQDVEHAVSADGPRLELKLLPVEEEAAPAALAFEPLPDEAPAPSVAAQEPPAPAASETGVRPVPAMPTSQEPPAMAGTPDAPAVAPAPAGAPATSLESVEVVSMAADTVVRIVGDGEFPYSTFLLEAPARFVIDLAGVVNHSRQTSVAVGGGPVDRVRVAQFKSQPPIARVVFDLQEPAVPHIERTSNALLVSFAPDADAAAAVSADSTPEVIERVGAPAPAPQAAPTHQPASALQPAPASAETRVASAQAAAPAASRREPQIEIEEAPEAPAPRPGAPRVPPPQPSDLELRPSAAQEEGVTSSRPPEESFASQMLGDGEQEYVGEPIDLKVTNADINDVLRTFAQLSGLNLIVQPGVRGVVTAEMENVPWDQALIQILKINNLGYELDGNIMRVAPTSVLREEARERQELAQARALAIPLRTIMKRLSYADARQVAAVLRSGQAGLLSQRGSVIVDARTNTLIIKELPTFLDAVVQVVENLDTPEPQVMIEARIVETTKRFSRSLGIDWGFEGVADAAHGNTTGLVFPNNVDADGGVNLLTGGDNALLNLSLGNVLNTFNLDITLQAAEDEGLINILSAPKIATLNNQQASIQSGLQIPVQTIANDTVTVQFVNATLRLNVTPHVTAEGTVLMDIDIQKRQPQLALALPGAPSAPISTKEAQTRVIVRDGGTTVIGGIYQVTTNDNEGRVPGLANVPLLGYLFRNKARSNENDELLIFITPRVMKL